MPEQVINQAYTGYWEAYDLQEDPFSEVDDNYTSSHWHEYHELLQHLSLYSNVMLAVAGEDDSGLGVFSKQFRNKINIHIDSHFIKADAYFDHNALLDAIVDAYSFAGIGSNSSDFSDRATSLLTNIERSEKSLLLIIDNAHLLSASTLEAILFFVKEQPADNALLHVILFGDLELQSKLSNLEQQTDSENFIHAIELELFSPEETERYLRHKVNQAGPEAVFPFSNQDILQIHKMSEGYIRRIDRFARDLLLERTSKTQSVAVKPLGKSRWLSTSLISVAIIATGYGWYRLHTLGNPYKPNEEATTIIPKSLTSLPETLMSKLKSFSSLSSSSLSNAKAKKKSSSKLASLIDGDNATPVDDGQEALQTKLKEIRQQDATQNEENSVVQHRINELIQSHNTKGVSASKPAASPALAAHSQDIGPSDSAPSTKQASTIEQVIAEHKTHETTGSANAQVSKKQSKTSKTASNKHSGSSRRGQNKLDPLDVIERDDVFGADEISDYDKELEQLKQAEFLDSPEEAAMIDKVVSVPKFTRKRSVVRRKKVAKKQEDKFVSLNAGAAKELDQVAPKQKVEDSRKVVSYEKYGNDPSLASLNQALASKHPNQRAFGDKAQSRRKPKKSEENFEIVANQPNYQPSTVTPEKKSLPTAPSISSALPASQPQLATVGHPMGPAPQFLNSTAPASVKPSDSSSQVAHHLAQSLRKEQHQAAPVASGNQYTLQLVGGHDKRNVQRFISQHGLKQAHVVKSRRAGKVWYIVTYGNYESFEQAKSAIRYLPSSVRGLNPWIRAKEEIYHASASRGRSQG